MSAHIPFSLHQNIPNESDQTNPTSISDILFKTRAEVQQNGPKTLIGKVAYDIEKSFRINPDISYIIYSQYNNKIANFSFNQNKTDIIAHVGSYSSYEAIIKKMYRKGEVTETTVKQMLQNLLREGGDARDLFEGLGNYASKLMALLICETFRFHDDGFLAKLALQDVINSNGNFYDVFLGGNSIASIFAQKNGKARMLDQLLGEGSTYNADFNQDRTIFSKENFSNNGNLQNRNGSNLTPVKPWKTPPINQLKEAEPLDSSN